MPGPGLFGPGFELWRASRAADGQGGHATTFAKVADLLGRLTPLSASSQIRAGQNGGVINHRFSCPGATDIRPGDEIRYDGRIFIIDAAPKTSTQRRRECPCEERQQGISA